MPAEKGKNRPPHYLSLKNYCKPEKVAAISLQSDNRETSHRIRDRNNVNPATNSRKKEKAVTTVKTPFFA